MIYGCTRATQPTLYRLQASTQCVKNGERDVKMLRKTPVERQNNVYTLRLTYATVDARAARDVPYMQSRACAAHHTQSPSLAACAI